MKIITFFLWASHLLAYDYWPTSGWRTRSFEKAHIDSYRFADFTDYVFDQDSGYQTHSLLVVKDGYLVYEKYTHGFTQYNKQRLLSISKSITGTLVGIAQKEGPLHVTHPVSAYVKVPLIQTWEEMKIDHLMKMSSGIDWYENGDYKKSDLLSHLYLKGRKDSIKYFFSRPISDAPGNVFNYSTGDSHFLAHLLTKAVGGSAGDFLQFTDRKLWAPLGITDYTVERDGVGNFYGGCYYYLRPRDLAKFGLLQLHRGTWDGQQIYLPDWYDYFTRMSWGIGENLNGREEVYGAGWFLNVEVPTLGPSRPYPMVPQDAFFAQGYYGQKLVIIPSLGLVVVRHGLDKKEGVTINVDRMLELLIGSLLE